MIGVTALCIIVAVCSRRIIGRWASAIKRVGRGVQTELILNTLAGGKGKQAPLTVINLQAPTPSRYRDTQDFRLWLKSFERFAAHIEDKKALLLLLLDEKSLDKLDNLVIGPKPNASYEEVTKFLTQLHEKGQISTDPLAELTLRRQEPHENLFQFATELECLAREAYKDASTPEQIDRVVSDRFVRGLNDQKLKEELCKVSNATTGEMLQCAAQLEKALSRCTNGTSAGTPLSTSNNNNPATSRQQQQPQQYYNNYNGRPNNRNNNNGGQAQYNGRQNNYYQGHNGQNHAQVNRQPFANQQDTQMGMPMNNKQDTNNNQDPGGFVPQVNVQSLRQRPKQRNQRKARPTPITGKCLMNQREVYFELDTGADVTIMNKATYDRLGPEVTLIPCDTEVSGASGQRLNILGSTAVELQMGRHRLNPEVLVAESLTRSCLLGRDVAESVPILQDAMSRLRSVVNTLSSDQVEDDELPVPLQTDQMHEILRDVPVQELAPKGLELIPYYSLDLFIQQVICAERVADSGITEEQLGEAVQEMKQALESIAAAKLTDIKPNSILQHEIHIVDPEQPPTKQKMRRIPFSKRDEFKKMLDEMLEAGLIRASTSPWSLPILLVAKKDGSIRFTVDYRMLNERTCKDAHPLPNTDDMFALLAKAKWFTKLDLFSGYYQIRMAEQSCQYTAFTCEWGLYEYVAMPMGLTNAPATFQRMMNQVLHVFIAEGFVSVYLDDILIYSSTLAEHVVHVQRVVEQLRKSGLLVKLKKCEIAKSHTQFLGHIFDSGEIKPDPSKIEALYRYIRPSTVKQLQSLLGLAQYYRKFVHNFSIIAAPLYVLTSANPKVPLQWDKGTDTAFQALRQALTTEHVLILPDFNKVFRLDTDASNDGMGAILSQAVGQDHRPIAYFSKHFSDAQKKYSTTEKELLAMVLAVEHFHQYLYGKQFEICADHQPLSWLRSTKKPNARLARWLIRLKNYEFTIRYRPGATHCNGDALSRWGDEPTAHTVLEEDELQLVIFIEGLESQTISPTNDYESFNLAPASDADLQWLLNLLLEHGDQKPELDDLKNPIRVVLYRYYLEFWFDAEDNRLYRRVEDKDGRWTSKIVLPKEQVRPILMFIHSSV
jgi:hypothetical protein